MPTSPKLRVAITLAAVALILAAWFSTLPPGTLIGDDLGFVWRDQHFGPAQMMPSTKFRPVLVAIMAVTVPLFGSSYAGYVGFNIVCEIAIAFLVFFIALRFSKGNEFIAACAAITFGLSRFSYFAVLQVGGIMESLALGLTLLIVFDVVVSYQDDDWRRLYRALLWFGLVIFVDERYVVLLPFVCIVPLGHAVFRRDVRWVSLFLGIAIAILATNFAIKSLLLHIHFLEGSGRELGFDPSLILSYFWFGVLNVIGFNIGPAYLSSRDISETGGVGYVLGFLVAVPISFVVIAYVIAIRRGAVPKARIYVVQFLVLCGSLLLSASVSFRQEFRFLYTPYVLLVVAMTAVAGIYARRAQIVNLVAAVFLLATLSSAVYYRQFIGNVYYEYSQNIANDVRMGLVGHPKDLVVIVTHGEPSVQHFIFQDHTYFDVYGIAAQIAFVDQLMQAKEMLKNTANSIAFDGTSGRMIPTSSVAMATQDISNKKMQYSFVHLFDSGKINSLEAVSTPNGQGALRIAWPFADKSIDSLTVLASFRYTYTNVPIRKGEELSFIGAVPYSIGIGARAFVDITDAGRKYRIVNMETLQALPSGPRWKKVVVPLDQFAGRRVSITFGTDKRGTDSRAAWMAFGDAGIRLR